MDLDEQREMVEDCMIRSEKLSDWEAGFIDSVSSQLDSGERLTQRAQDKLEEIWEAVTADPAGVRKR